MYLYCGEVDLWGALWLGRVRKGAVRQKSLGTTALAQSSGYTLSLNRRLKRLVRKITVEIPDFINISARIPSNPGDFPLFRLYMASDTSSSVISLFRSAHKSLLFASIACGSGSQTGGRDPQGGREPVCGGSRVESHKEGENVKRKKRKKGERKKKGRDIYRYREWDRENGGYCGFNMLEKSFAGC